jgi:hypothetical protein
MDLISKFLNLVSVQFPELSYILHWIFVPYYIWYHIILFSHIISLLLHTLCTIYVLVSHNLLFSCYLPYVPYSLKYFFIFPSRYCLSFTFMSILNQFFPAFCSRLYNYLPSLLVFSFLPSAPIYITTCLPLSFFSYTQFTLMSLPAFPSRLFFPAFGSRLCNYQPSLLVFSFLTSAPIVQ